jgi:hypothetical protein
MVNCGLKKGIVRAGGEQGVDGEGGGGEVSHCQDDKYIATIKHK